MTDAIENKLPDEIFIYTNDKNKSEIRSFTWTETEFNTPSTRYVKALNTPQASNSDVEEVVNQVRTDLIRMAAKCATGYGLPSHCIEDYQKRVPKWVLHIFEDINEKSRIQATRIKAISNKLGAVKQYLNLTNSAHSVDVEGLKEATAKYLIEHNRLGTICNTEFVTRYAGDLIDHLHKNMLAKDPKPLVDALREILNQAGKTPLVVRAIAKQALAEHGGNNE